MSRTKERIAAGKERSAEFRAAYDEEAALFAQEQARRADLMKQIATVRKSQKMTQHVLAEKMKVSQARVSQIERGDETFSVDSFLSMLDALGAHLVVAPATAAGEPAHFRLVKEADVTRKVADAAKKALDAPIRETPKRDVAIPRPTPRKVASQAKKTMA